MRCDDFRVMLEETRADAMPELVRAHLEKCTECRSYAEDWGRVSEAFLAAAAEPLPERSVPRGNLWRGWGGASLSPRCFWRC